MVNKKEKLQKYIEQSNFKEALNVINKLLKKEKTPALLNTKGVILLQDGKINFSIEIFLKAIKLDPFFTDALNNLGMAYQKAGFNEKAVSYLSKAISLKNNYIEARYNLALVYDNMDEPYKVINELELLLKYEPKHAPSLILLGDIYNRINNVDVAQKYHEEALKFDLSSKGLFKLGMDYIFQGNKDRGIDCFKPTLPYHMPSFYVLASNTDYEFNNSELDFLIKTFNEDKDVKNKSMAGFAYAKILKKNKEYQKSFEVLIKANDLKRSITPFDQESFFKKIKSIEDYFLKIQEMEITITSCDLRPIFILGTPRSGTTFIEQIISNHIEIYGAGEVNKLHKFFDELILKKNFSIDSLKKIRDDYFCFIRKMTQKSYFIDKTPFNSFYIGLIKKIFPESLIIHTIRDLKSVAFSMYETDFDNLKYTNCLEDIIFYLKNYKENLNFWNQYEFDKYITINLEKFVKETEIETKKIFSLLDLDFEKSFLDPTRNKKPVYTASAGQVRKKNLPKPVYSVENYGAIIEEFNSSIDKI